MSLDISRFTPLLASPDELRAWYQLFVQVSVTDFYGGFAVELRRPERESADPVPVELEVSSWCRVWGGSGQRHRITADGVELVEDGFV